MHREYTICKLRVPRTLLDRGFVFPPDKELRARLMNAYGWTDEAQELLAIEQFEKSLDGRDIISLTPLEKESSEAELVMLALLSRITEDHSDGTRN